MSQLLSRLDVTLRSASDPLIVAEAKVRKSCYLSRTGYFEESKGLIAELRKSFGAGQNPRISAWIMLAEGVAEYFEHVGPGARDRVARAQLIALAFHDKELGAITSAWKAHMDFECSDFVAMTKSLKSGMELADSSNHEAHCRLAAVLSNCLYLCGDRADAQKWFMISRDHALAEGDQATIDALLYNKAAFGLAQLRAARCFGALDPGLVDLVELEISSAENFQSITRIVSLNHLIRLCKARILLLQDRFPDALRVFASIRSAEPFAKYNFSEGIVDLEVAFCLKKLGQHEDAASLLGNLGEVDSSDLDIDDRLVISWLKTELAPHSPRLGDPLLLLQNLESLQAEYLIYIAHVRHEVAEVLRPH